MNQDYIKELADTLNGVVPEEPTASEDELEIRELKTKGYPLNKVIEAIETEGMGDEVKNLAEHIYTDE